MLQFIFGKTGTGKTYYLRNVAADAAKENKRVYFIVPDQFTFDYEKYFIMNLSVNISAQIKVLSFSRLAEEILRVYGGCAVPRIDDSARLLLMNLAIESCSDNLKLLKSDSFRLADSMLQVVNELKNDSVMPEDIFAAINSGKTTLPKNLRDKLSDISLIYSSYNALTANSYSDSADLIMQAAGKLKNKEYFADSIVILDSFETIDSQKRKIVYEMLESADCVYMGFCCNGIHDEDDSFFSPVSRTARYFRNYAAEHHIEISNPKLFTENKRTSSVFLQHLSRNVFSDYPEVIEDCPNNILVFEANTITEELEFVASKIRELVIYNNISYSDIAVMAHDAASYYLSIESVFRKWDIPFFYSNEVNLNTSPLVRFIFSAFSIVINRFRTEDILNFLKTDLTEFTVEDISKLENYAYVWRIDGKKWLEEFTMNPDGAANKAVVQERIQEVEMLRSKLISRLLSFENSIKNKTGLEITEAVFELFELFSVNERLQSKIQLYRGESQVELADDIVRVWDKVIDTLDTFVTILGDRLISIDRYYELIKLILTAEDRRDVPLRPDTVIFGSLDAVAQASPKVTFIIGAQNGELPYIPESSGILSDSEKKRMQENSISLENFTQDIALIEEFNTYKAISSPSEKIFMSYHKKNYNEDTSEGSLIESVLSIFPSIEVVKNYDESNYLNSDEAILSYYARIVKTDNSLKPTIDAYINTNQDLSHRVNKLLSSADNSRLIVGDKSISKKFLQNGALSASQIDTFHQCKFRYFCQYTLNAKERRKASIDVQLYGTLMHYIFEKILSGDFNRFTDNDELLEREIYIIINKFKKEEVSGLDKLLPSDNYRINRIAFTAFTLVKRIIEELKQSKFSPIGWEERLSERGTFPPFKIITEDGQAVSVGGVIDRVDEYISEGNKYIRIVDYKTGRKEFKISEVIYGLNLQMLIYLASICSSGDYKPAGILYMPSRSEVFSAKRTDTAEEIKNGRDEKQKMNGAVLNSEEIIHAMEAAASGKYIPIKIKRNGEIESSSRDKLYSEEEFNAIFSYTRKLLTSMANTIIEGDLSPNPMMKEKHNSCSWCPYKAVCLSAKDGSEEEKDTIKRKDAMSIIERGEVYA